MDTATATTLDENPNTTAIPRRTTKAMKVMKGTKVRKGMKARKKARKVRKKARKMKTTKSNMARKEAKDKDKDKAKTYHAVIHMPWSQREDITPKRLDRINTANRWETGADTHTPPTTGVQTTRIDRFTAATTVDATVRAATTATVATVASAANPVVKVTKIVTTMLTILFIVYRK